MATSAVVWEQLANHTVLLFVLVAHSVYVGPRGNNSMEVSTVANCKQRLVYTVNRGSSSTCIAEGVNLC